MSQSTLKFISDFIREHSLSKNTFRSLLRQFGYKSFGCQLTPGMENGLCKVLGFKIPYPDVDIIYPPKLEFGGGRRKNPTLQNLTNEKKAANRSKNQQLSENIIREGACGWFTFVSWPTA